MRIVDVIAKKRDGGALSREEIDFFVGGVTSGTIPEYQSSALLMAIVINGMNAEETAQLTDAMLRSGGRVDLSDIPGTKVGKHSTGGVGDKVSIVLAPLAAALGVILPKMSGRGLGHTGGTLDKLESIPGFRVNLSVDEFKKVLRTVGTCIIGQTESLAPADRKLYALRDVTGTVEAIPLLASSIMSKKLAEGSDALLLDVKAGDGAFMKTVEGARALGEAMVAIGTRAGLRTEAVITDMDSPLGFEIGNASEIIEAIETLRGRGPACLTSVVTRVGCRVLAMAGVEQDEAAAIARMKDALTSGAALQTFVRMIEAQGGDVRVVDDYSLLPLAPDREVFRASRSGWITAIKAGAIGRASNALGAGRGAIDETIDHGVGITVRVYAGVEVRQGELLIELRHRGGRGLAAAMTLVREAVVIGDAPPAEKPKVIAELR